jgi:hypothetical protein
MQSPASLASCGRVGDGPLETEQSELNAKFGQLLQIRDHLRLAERVEHSVIRNEKDAFSVE